MKRILSIIICLLMIVGCFCGCEEQVRPEDKRLTVVAATFTEYDWVMNILGDEAPYANVRLLIGGGVDVHSYQPTATDIITIGECDILVYTRGSSTEWIYEAARLSNDANRTTVEFVERLGKSSLIALPGHEGHNHEPEYDEHIWLSLKNAVKCCEAIAKALGAVDKDYAEIYTANANEYILKLEALDKEYQKVVDKSENKTLVFGDRYPFRYLANDYGIKCYTAFDGCSAESEADFETITTLANVVDKQSVPVVLTIDGSNGDIAKSIVKNTKSKKQEILTLNSLQSVSEKQIKENKISYLSAMEDNLEVISKALGDSK